MPTVDEATAGRCLFPVAEQAVCLHCRDMLRSEMTPLGYPSVN